MIRISRNVSAILLACLLAFSVSGCNRNSTQQAERCLSALSAVQSADRVHATISLAYGENELEISSIVEYWKSGDNSLCSITSVAVEDNPQVWDFKYNGTCYTKSVYEEPVEEGVEYPVNWTESESADPDTLAFWQAFHRSVEDLTLVSHEKDGDSEEPTFNPDTLAFWQEFHQTAEDLTFVSQEKEGNNEVLTFQIPLSDEEKQAEDGSQFSDLFVSFTLGEEDTLLEYEARHTVTVDTGSAQYSEIWLNHAVFEDINDASIQDIIETEWETSPHITNHTDSLDSGDLGVIWSFTQNALETRYGELYTFQHYEVEFSNDHIEDYIMSVDLDVSVDMIDKDGQTDPTGIALQAHFPYDNIRAEKVTLYWREEIDSEVYIDEFDSTPIES